MFEKKPEKHFPDRPLECGDCKKPIAIRYTEIVGDLITHTSMCADCPELQRRLYGTSPQEHVYNQVDPTAALECGNCGTTLEEIKRGHRLGCPECYTVFEDVILLEMQAANRLSPRVSLGKKNLPIHIGRAPGESLAINPSSRLLALNEALKETLGREDYEQAALLRDQIKALTDSQYLKERLEDKSQVQTSGSSHDPLLCNESPWNHNNNLIWLGSTVALHRNIEKFKFPGKLAPDKRQQIISLINQELLASPQLKNPKLIRAEDMPPIEKEFLVEHFLTSQSFHQTHTGEAFVLDETGEFLAVLNLNDHVFMEWIDQREDLEGAWNHLVKIESNLSQAVNLAFSPQFGFLTADPTECGTGLTVSVFLHLPGLLHSNRLEEVIKKTKDEGIRQTGLQGNPNEIIGDILVLHNNYTLGLTEENILSSLRTLATKLIAEEKSVRSFLENGHGYEISIVKDKVSRAYGILMHSYQIEAVEALQALSLLKLGLDLHWLEGTQQKTLNALLFSCRRAYLLCHYAQKIQQDELSHKRAEFIHQQLRGLTLLI